MYGTRRRDIVLRAWNYPGVQNFSRADPLFRNSYSFIIPLVSTLSSSICSKFLDVLQTDMKGNLPFQVCVFDIYLLLSTAHVILNSFFPFAEGAR